MYLHCSAEELKNMGYNLVAEYECFEKGHKTLYIECYQNGNVYLVRNILKRYAWDDLYIDKNKANERVKDLRSMRKWYKMTFPVEGKIKRGGN